MSTHATDQHGSTGRRDITRAGPKATGKKPAFFKMRAQMLEKGRTNTALART